MPGIWVAVHDDPLNGGDIVMTSPDAVVWTDRNNWTNTPVSDNGFTAAFGAGLFVLGAHANFSFPITVASSPDGILWTSEAALPSNSIFFSKLIYAGGQFVGLTTASGISGAMTSPDGIVWTQHTVPIPDDSYWRDLCYSPDFALYVAVGTNFEGDLGLVMTSPDGANWTLNPTTPPVGQLQCVTYGLGLFVAFGAEGGYLMTSPDGVTWSLQADPAGSATNWLATQFGGGIFVAVGGGPSGQRAILSLDGINWTLETTPADRPWISLAYGNGLFVSCANDDADTTHAVMTSPDGIVWTLQTTPDAPFAHGAAFGIGGGTPLAIVCGAPPSGMVGVPYSHFFPASGGTPPYTFAIIAGSLPDGLVLDPATGEAAGTPTLAGTFPFTVQVTDSTAATASVSCAITIAPPPVSISCAVPPIGVVGVSYSHFFPAADGVPPYTFAITAGTLPTGLALNAATGEVTGTPTVVGTFPFTVQVTDSTAATATANCSITVAAVSPIVTPAIFPSSGAPFFRGGVCNRASNEWDECLERLAASYRRIKIPLPCSIPEPYKNLLPWDEDFGAIPEQSKPLRTTAGIFTPPTIAGDQVMVSYRVPNGYFGLLSGFFFQYTGVGFAQGSGDLIFRLKLNQRYVKDLSAVPFTLGSPKFPVPMTEGQVLLSGQVVESIVNVPNLSGLIQIGASTCYAGLFGFLWPYG